MTTCWLGLLLSGAAAAGTPAAPAPQPAPVIEVVPQFPEGQVRLVAAGREGDAVSIDGWQAGELPLTTQLAEGPHQFVVEGSGGKLQVEIYVKVKPKDVLEIDLAHPPKQDPPPAPVAPVPAKADPPAEAG
ncbi:MAG: PEGA domain-containing protein [Myxococcota bacterium]